MTLGTTAYPVTLPSIRDPRLQVAAVIVTIHVLGQVALDFRVSVPQILAAILTSAVIEVAWTFRESRSFVWPASAMLTGSGVALILRVSSTPPGDHWTAHHWYVFAGVAAVSLLTKYVIRYRGSPLFNPSNIGLVAAFLVLGSARVEPLDFWWSPLDGPMILAYAVILIGGVLITRRLHLLAAAATFWGGLAAGVGLVAASGHCMVARWAFAPVCGFDFWLVIVTSPEVLIFLFFMLTDPKTVPPGRVGRVVFALVLAVVSTVLVAPQTNEFGTKVAVLGSLVIVCAARPLLERLVPPAGSDDDDPLQFAGRLVTGGTGPALARGGGLFAAVALAGIAIVAAGAPLVASSTRRRRTCSAGCRAISTRPRSVDRRRLRSRGLEPRDHRRGRSADRAGARREPRARAPGVACAVTPTCSKRSITATGSTSCAIASRKRRRVAPRSPSSTRSTTCTSRSSSRSASSRV